MILVSQGDIIDLFLKIKERGHEYLLKKFHIMYDTIVRATWAEQYGSYNWLDVPRVRERINRFITGDPKIDYPVYVMRKFFAAARDLRMLSLGCGAGCREITFAKTAKGLVIDALDISTARIASAIKNARENGIRNINFFAADVYSYHFNPNHYDIILCQSFLHHCRNVQGILERLCASIRRGGILIVHDYVGPERFQWTKDQVALVNRLLSQLSWRYRVRASGNTLKSKVYPPGILRMMLSDPSEAIESSRILPMIRRYFRIVEEKNLGGNVLHLLFKDIAQNFLPADKKINEMIDMIFGAEDEFLEKGHKSDFIFGIYRAGHG